MKTRKRQNESYARLRGVIAGAKNNRPNSRVRSKAPLHGLTERQRAFHFRLGIQDVLLHARTEIRPAGWRGFLSSLKSLAGPEINRFSRQPIASDYLRFLIPAKPMPLDLEITWIAERLELASRTLTEHLESCASMQEAFLGGEKRHALARLEASELCLGVSLWSTAAKLSLVQEIDGTEAQRNILKDIRSSSKKAAWPFLATFFSQRAEEGVSIGWYLDDARRRLERMPSSDVTKYLTYKLLSKWPADDADMAAVLRVEQCHHVVDIYETFIDLLQKIVSESGHRDEVIRAARLALEKMPQQDFRVGKLRRIFGDGGPEGINGESVEVFLGSGASRIKGALSKAKDSSFVQTAFSLAIMLDGALSYDHPIFVRDTKNSKRFIKGLNAALRRTSVSGGANALAEDVRKHGHVFQWLSHGRALMKLTSAAAAKSYPAARGLASAAALNCSGYGSLDLVSRAGSLDYQSLRAYFGKSPVTDFCDLIAEGWGGDVESEHANLSHVQYALMVRAYLNKDFELATEVFKCGCAGSRIVEAHGALLALNAMCRTGDIELASNVISNEHVIHSVDPKNLPIHEIFEGTDWRTLKNAAKDFDLSIALSLLPGNLTDDKMRTYRRFAIETLLNKYGITKPSEFRSLNTGKDEARLIYFLSKVCSSYMLDMLPEIDSTRAVLTERREICGFLRNLDSARSEIYEQEILEISRELTVQDGLRNIDGSRVHVDVDALSAVVKKDLSETFTRYQEILRIEDRTTESFLAVLREILRRDQADNLLLPMPQNESDELLVSMITRTRERFLFDVPHGLDSYLSKRIRHGSIVGFIRAPAEREKLIARRSSDGSYGRDGTWAEFVRDPLQRGELVDAIQHLSKAIDGYLFRLRDVLLHVRSEQRPLGLLDVPLTVPTYMLIRSVTKDLETVDDFVSVLFKSLWGLLNPSLISVRDILGGDAIRFASEQFQTLRIKGHSILRSSEEKAELDTRIGAASTGVQAALQTAAAWFEPVDATPHTYTLSEVADIAVASVRAVNQGFTPELTIDGDENIIFSENSLPVISDILYIAFGNIAQRSEAGDSPEVYLSVRGDGEPAVLKIKVRNAVGDIKNRGDVLARLEQIRSDLASERGKRWVRAEGGSGMHKIWSIVSQSELGTLSFELEDEHFALDVSVPYSVAESFQV